MVFKCKMCGGDIPAETGAVFGTCDSCGTTTTLPKANEERVVNLFNRANHFRRLNEFDKALATYENILNEDSASAEAHWGIVLCRFGIEYVEDPKTHERVPTCHRVQHESVLTDADYLAALENAPDSYTKGLYEAEAKKISEIQKGILAISSREEPFDIFICYKETADGGSRTKDSTLAQDIYYQLTNEGYRVFFSRITLEDRLGQGYEPFIFSALNSAKVMLVVGTKKEYFEAVWVKNEWSRFLSLMKNDRSRLLIPCYRDIDAYDMPDELSHLQSQDMGKIGFVQDLIRGVKKVLAKDEAKQGSAATPVGAANATAAAPGVESLMKRGNLFLEDSEWGQANEYFDRVLDIDPEYAPAYVGKLCVDVRKQREGLLGSCGEPLAEQGNFKKAVRFADAATRCLVPCYNGANELPKENKKLWDKYYTDAPKRQRQPAEQY
ncbi:MAG: toll/interleukin-1 receptor domain-containing protein, partial [Defluviitaleaceae bacterium]|nr:toll/interleukin-1 receptor domain-containing protein [Defluviitaleaceae bacterium]